MRYILGMPEISSLWVFLNLSIGLLKSGKVVTGNEISWYFAAFGVPKMPFH
jgi:hypothetical protein